MFKPRAEKIIISVRGFLFYPLCMGILLLEICFPVFLL